MRVTLIRHTRVDVPEGLCYGRSDVPLAASFRQEEVGVARLLVGKVYDRVYSSPLVRCRKLAAHCGYADCPVDDRLLELNFGRWEMQLWSGIQDPLLEEWYQDWVHIPAGGGESFWQQYTRFSAFVEELKASGSENVCLFTHSGIIRCARLYVGDCKLEEVFDLETPYGGEIVLEI